MWDNALPLLLGLDSLVAGLAVAPLLRTSRSRSTGAVVFGAADAGASLLGSSIAVGVPGVVVVAPAFYGLYLLLAGAVAAGALERAHRLGRASALPTVTGLALAFSVDNLVAGEGASVVASGCSSAVLMLLGALAGGRVLDHMPNARRTVWIGAGLMVSAILAVWS